MIQNIPKPPKTLIGVVRYIRVLFPRLGRQAGIAKRVHAHGFRQTHASELRAEGVDVGFISKQPTHATGLLSAYYGSRYRRSTFSFR